ncbi:DUF2586 family protein [Flectobacillus roseus]
MLPSVKITIANGGLGRVATTSDGVAALVIPAVATANLPLYTPKQIFTLKEAETLGLTQDFDTAQKIDAWKQISDFYTEAGNGAELWIMTYTYTKTMAEMCDVTTSSNGVRKLLDAANGTIRLLAIGRYIDPTKTYTPTITGGMDSDSINAMQKLNALSLEYLGAYKPFVGIVDGRQWNGVIADLLDLKTYTYPKVSMLLGTNVDGKRSSAVGISLGRLAKLPVQRNIARVKDGALNVTAGYLTDGRSLGAFTEAQVQAIHDKGYLVYRYYTGRSGVYHVDDPTATVATDDFLTISNNRVIHKAVTLTYQAYLDEVNDDLILSDGKINPAQVGYLRSKIENSLKINMLDAEEISAISVYIDSTQNVISTDKIRIVLRIVPVAYGKTIEVDLGFTNPSLAA